MNQPTKSLKIQLSRKADGTSVIACTRADGSATWQRYKYDFFPLHDLTHLAVESTLKLRYGFFGLLIDGWNITDFGDREMPEHAKKESIFSESVVGMLDQELQSGVRPDWLAFNDALKDALQQLGHPMMRHISESELNNIREMRLDLSGKWTRTPTGESMNVTFEI